MDGRTDGCHVVDRMANLIVRGERVRALMYDLSIAGCMIESPRAKLASGDLVLLELENSIDVGGTVVWSIGENAGIKFDATLHDAVVRFVGFSPPRPELQYSIPRDRFGRRLAPQLGWDLNDY